MTADLIAKRLRHHAATLRTNSLPLSDLIPLLCQAADALDTQSPAEGDDLSILREEQMGRDYIPLPGGWELQTKGNGSTLRLLDKKSGERYPLPLPDFVIEFIERMALEVNTASRTKPKAAEAGETEREHDWPKDPAFDAWWDSDRLTQTNPYAEGSPVFWAWEGWQARIDTQPKDECTAPLADLQAPAVVTDHVNAMRMALEALEKAYGWNATTPMLDTAITGLRDALASQPPVQPMGDANG